MADYIALEPGFYDGKRLRKGAAFDAPEGFKASWAAPAVAVVQKKLVAKSPTLTLPPKGKGGSSDDVPV